MSWLKTSLGGAFMAVALSISAAASGAAAQNLSKDLPLPPDCARSPAPSEPLDVELMKSCIAHRLVLLDRECPEVAILYRNANSLAESLSLAKTCAASIPKDGGVQDHWAWQIDQVAEVLEAIVPKAPGRN